MNKTLSMEPASDEPAPGAAASTVPLKIDALPEVHEALSAMRHRLRRRGVKIRFPDGRQMTPYVQNIAEAIICRCLEMDPADADRFVTEGFPIRHEHKTTAAGRPFPAQQQTPAPTPDPPGLGVPIPVPIEPARPDAPSRRKKGIA